MCFSFPLVESPLPQSKLQPTFLQQPPASKHCRKRPYARWQLAGSGTESGVGTGVAGTGAGVAGGVGAGTGARVALEGGGVGAAVEQKGPLPQRSEW